MTKTPSKEAALEAIYTTPPEELTPTRAQLALLSVARRIGEIQDSADTIEPAELAKLIDRGSALHAHLLRLSVDDPEVKATLDAFARKN